MATALGRRHFHRDEHASRSWFLLERKIGVPYDLSVAQYADRLAAFLHVGYDGDLGRPNLYVPLSRTAGRSKVRHLITAFGTQRAKRWFTADTFEGLLRLRGIEAGAAEGYAEAFHAHKALLEP